MSQLTLTGFFALAVVLAALRPTWILPLLVAILPLRLPVGGDVHLPTVVLIGAALGRIPAIARAVRRQPAVAAAFLALPLWMLTSGAWARQPWFAVRESGSWFAVALAAGVALAEDRRSPRPLLVAAFLALIP